MWAEPEVLEFKHLNSHFKFQIREIVTSNLRSKAQVEYSRCRFGALFVTDKSNTSVAIHAERRERGREQVIYNGSLHCETSHREREIWNTRTWKRDHTASEALHGARHRHLLLQWRLSAHGLQQRRAPSALLRYTLMPPRLDCSGNVR